MSLQSQHCLNVVYAFQKKHVNLPVFYEIRIRKSSNPTKGVNKCEEANALERDAKRSLTI